MPKVHLKCMDTIANFFRLNHLVLFWLNFEFWKFWENASVWRLDILKEIDFGYIAPPDTDFDTTGCFMKTVNYCQCEIVTCFVAPCSNFIPCVAAAELYLLLHHHPQPEIPKFQNSLFQITVKNLIYMPCKLQGKITKTNDNLITLL